MKYGVREICDVVLKAKTNQKVGNKIFYKNEPVIYFDTLKTSTLEGAATTVYAQGGRGNSRLMAWEGERTVTFTMEDALISPAGFMILSGAGLTEAGDGASIIVHRTEQTDKVSKNGEDVVILLSEKPHVVKGEDSIYVMRLENGEVNGEPYIPAEVADTPDADGFYALTLKSTWDDTERKDTDSQPRGNQLDKFMEGDVVLVDFYVERTKGVQEITITPDKFGGNYYLEASTLFRDQNGADKPAEFIIPNCKIQSNFTFTMASSGDPSTFTFTMDAFPDYTRFDKTKKVLAVIQVIEEGEEGVERVRVSTQSLDKADVNGMIDGERPFPGFPEVEGE